MDEDELREWVGQRLAVKIPDGVWDLVREDGFLNAVDDREREDLVRRVARLLQIFSSKPMQKRRRRVARKGEELLKPVLKTYESQRAKALAEYYAKVAEAMPEVRRFRQDVLGGKYLSKRTALQILASPAARMLPPEAFLQYGIPLSHESKVVSEEYSRGKKFSARLEVTPPGVQVDFDYAIKPGDTFWEGVPGNQVLTVRVDGQAQETAPFNGSLLDHLRLAGLALQALPWRKGDATWFVLTGEIPAFGPMSSNISMNWNSFASRGQIELRIEPWISAVSVAAMYARAQQRFLGRHNRPIGERRLALFRFVIAATDENLEIPPWRSLMDTWNKRNKPNKPWQYKNVRNFSRDYWSVSRSLTFPDYGELYKGIERKQ